MFDIVRTELNKVDPIGLYPGKVAPIDEYEPEAAMVLTKIKNVKNYIELAKEIASVFTEMFGEKFKDNSFYDCAQNILEQLNKNSLRFHS